MRKVDKGEQRFELTDTESEKELTRGKGLADTMTLCVTGPVLHICTDTFENDYILIHL